MSDTATPLAVVRLREGTGTPLVLLHGFGSESASWRPLLGEMTDGNPVLGIDLAGHGASLAHEADGFEALISGVENTLIALGLSSCHLVGHSLGGAVALGVASGTASDVRSLLLIAPAGFGPDIDTGFTEGFARATDEAPVRAWLRHSSPIRQSCPRVSCVRPPVREPTGGRRMHRCGSAPSLLQWSAAHLGARSPHPPVNAREDRRRHRGPRRAGAPFHWPAWVDCVAYLSEDGTFAAD